MGENMDSSPQLLDLIPKEREWMVRKGGGRNGYEGVDEKKLELTLAPPGGEDWSVVKQKTEKDTSSLSLTLFPKSSKNPFKRGFTDTLEPESKGYEQPQKKDGIKADQKLQMSHEKAGAPAVADCKTTDAHKRSHASTSPTPVVGWPPIRSFRKNLASSSSKPPLAPENAEPAKQKKVEVEPAKGLFVKINMDGIPIGRKVDLKAFDSYEKLCSSVDELFRGLLAAQKEPVGSEENPSITGLLDGSGEYTLVYEDNEGDRMLAGDVPWNMFVSMVKRLRVLKSSELASELTLGKSNKKRASEEQLQGLK